MDISTFSLGNPSILLDFRFFNVEIVICRRHVLYKGRCLLSLYFFSHPDLVRLVNVTYSLHRKFYVSGPLVLGNKCLPKSDNNSISKSSRVTTDQTLTGLTDA